MLDLVIQRGNGDRDNKEHREDKLKGEKFNVVISHTLGNDKFFEFCFHYKFQFKYVLSLCIFFETSVTYAGLLNSLMIKEFSQVIYLMCCCVYFPDGQNRNIIPFLSL